MITNRKSGYPFKGEIRFYVRLSGDRISWFTDYWKADKSAKRHESSVELVDVNGRCYQVRPALIERMPSGMWGVPDWDAVPTSPGASSGTNAD